MTTKSKQERLGEFLHDILISDVGVEYTDDGVDYDGAIKNIEKLINSEVLAALEDLERQTTNTFIAPSHGVPLSAIQTIKERYNG